MVVYVSRFALTSAALVLILGLFPASAARAQDKPLLSAEIRKVLESDGIEAATKRFDEIYPEQKDAYEIDVKGLAELSTGYMQTGKMEAGMAVLQMTSRITQAMIQDANAGQSEQMRQFQERLDSEQATAETEPPPPVEETYDPGTARGDLLRFTGLYGDPENGDERRRLWVSMSCDGFLVAGALWGDASPLWMKSVGDASFTYADSFTRLSMRFEPAGGTAARMVHDLSFMPTPLERVGPLPEDWEKCVERGVR